LILTSVDHEGTGLGFDKDFINLIADKVSIPVIVHGGAGKEEDVLEIIKHSHVDAICAAAIFHYGFIKNNIADFNQSEGNFDFLKSGRSVKNIETINIVDLKSYLAENGVSLRN
jgi:cyclase